MGGIVVVVVRMLMSCVRKASKHASTSGGGESIGKKLKLNSAIVGRNFIREEGIIFMQNWDPTSGVIDIPPTELVQDTLVEVIFVTVFE